MRGDQEVRVVNQLGQWPVSGVGSKVGADVRAGPEPVATCSVPRSRCARTPPTGATAQDWLDPAWGTVGIEGVVLKDPAQPYLPGRRAWTKVRNRMNCISRNSSYTFASAIAADQSP
ncbi:hypothetical protein ACFU96_43280 [Streptomyces sp. NPDC057620]|uniref:hypothetical protein n=1 Tax=Streptomyces sp. NPDC057620 TaxID=3346185 RepID=UPI0036AB366B